jgi:GT2 family glycosyltransferase
MKISAIIVTYNGQTYIEKLFQSLLKAITPQLDVEVVVVDNGSTDGTLNLVEKYKAAMGDKLKIVKLGKNLGFAGGNDAGLLFSSGDVIFLLNQDTYIDEKAFTAIHELFSKRPDVGAAQCLLFQYRYPNLLDSCGDVPSNIGMGIIGCWGVRKNEVNIEEREIPLARGAALAIRRSILELSRKVYGAYIPIYFIAGGYEDWFLTLFTKLLGYKVILYPKCVVYHDSIEPRKRNFYVIFNAINLFIEFKAPISMIFGRIFSAVFSIVMFNNKEYNTRIFIESLKSVISSSKRSIKFRYYIEILAKERGITLKTLWENKVGITEWNRWYLRYIRASSQYRKRASAIKLCDPRAM